MLPLLRHVPEVSVEEFVDGEEFTYDTVCADGQILFENMLWYRPRPLQMRMHEWVSPVSISLRDLTVPHLQGGRQMGAAVLAALGFQHRLHAHGVVPQGRRRGRLRRDRRAAAGGARRRPDELRHRRRRLRRLGRGGRARPDAAARAPVQRRRHLQAGARGRADHARRGLDRLLAEYGEHVVARRPAAGRGAAARLALVGHRRRHDRSSGTRSCSGSSR